MAKKVERFANDRIANLVNYIRQPTEEKVRGLNDPYFYGMPEASWRDDQMALHRAIKEGSQNPRLMQRLNEINGSPKEIQAFIDFSRDPRNKITRHMDVGVPHARVNEQIHRDALLASGIDTRFNNSGDHLATDLRSMIGNLKQYVDVQNRHIDPRGRDMFSLGVFQGMKGPYEGTGLRAYQNASGGTQIQDIMEDARQMNLGNNRLNTDKLYQEKGITGVRPGSEKDFISTGKIDKNKIRNLTAQRHGNYNPTAPSRIDVIDMNALRDSLYPMTKREYESMGGTLIRDSNKLKLRLPTEQVLQLGMPQTQLISDNVNEALGAIYSGRL